MNIRRFQRLEPIIVQIRKVGLYDQAFAVLLPLKTVGVMGDP